MEQIEILNRALFLKINASPDTASWVTGIAKVVADDLIYAIPALLVVYWLWGSEAKRSLALRAFLVAMLGSFGVASLSHALILPVWRRMGNAVTTSMEMLYRNVMAGPISRGLVRR